MNSGQKKQIKNNSLANSLLKIKKKEVFINQSTDHKKNNFNLANGVPGIIDGYIGNEHH